MSHCLKGDVLQESAVSNSIVQHHMQPCEVLLLPLTADLATSSYPTFSALQQSEFETPTLGIGGLLSLVCMWNQHIHFKQCPE